MKERFTETRRRLTCPVQIVVAALLSCAGIVKAQTMVGFSTVDSHATYTFGDPSIIYYQSQLHMFDRYTGLDIVRWCAPNGGGCTWTDFDGDSNSGGHVVGQIETRVFPFVWSGDGKLHTFYTYRAIASGSPYKLRHASYDGTTWSYETIDGNGGSSGQITESILADEYAIGVAAFSNWLFVSYSHFGSPHTLRLAWFNGSVWGFTDLDGAGGANGRVSGNVGEHSTMIASSTHLHIFYPGSSMRHAWWNGSGDWNFAYMSGNNYQSTNERVGATYHGGLIHLFYPRNTGTDIEIVHGWDGSTWNFATHENGLTVNADENQQRPAACSDGTNIHAFYRKNTDLRHTWDGPSSWYFETADGHQTSMIGQMNGEMEEPWCTVGAQSKTYAIYREAASRDIRRSNN